MRLKAGALLVFSCGVLAIAGCGSGGKHYYSRSATEACLSAQAKLGTNFSGGPGAAPEATGGDLDVTRSGHDLWLGFGADPSEARSIAKDVQFFAPQGAGTIAATNGNVAYWTDASLLTSADRNLVAGCLR